MSPLGDFPYLACYHPSENIPSAQDNQLGFRESFMLGRNLPFAQFPLLLESSNISQFSIFLLGGAS